MITLKEQLQRSIEKLERRSLRYALAGGLAASVYGEERLTKDIDFIIDGKDDLVEIAKEILSELNLSVSVARKADLDGGPLFAIKRQNTQQMIVIGRDQERKDPGVDFLLPTNPWVPKALERANDNQIDFGFRKIPTLTVEDVIICKLLSSHKPEREQDILDLRSIFQTGHNDLDFAYIAARMKKFGATLLKNLEGVAPSEIVEVSRRIAREQKKHHRGAGE